MLQQTTVSAVARRYEGFLRRFPDLSSLARAREESVLAAWSGLGYYARARNLRRAAREIVSRHAGRIPREADSLAGLPGLGPYTAAAIASLAFGARVPAAETNVTRVLSRLFAIEGRANSRRHRAAVLGLARSLLPASQPGDATAALMDLGQLICTPSRPACPSCPLRTHCRGHRLGRPEAYPERAARNRPVPVALAAVFARRGRRALLVRRESELWNGLWEFPSAEGRSAAAARRELRKRIQPLRLRIASPRPAGRVRHTVVNRKIRIEVFAGQARPGSGTPDPGRSMRWLLPQELSRAAIPTLTRKIARAVGFLN